MSHTDAELAQTATTHKCNCGRDTAELPELDARTIPHAIRHASIFGALDSLTPGTGMVLVAPHDPLPLLGQARSRYGDAMGIDYLQRGPDAWRVQFTRTS